MVAGRVWLAMVRAASRAARAASGVVIVPAAKAPAHGLVAAEMARPPRPMNDSRSAPA